MTKRDRNFRDSAFHKTSEELYRRIGVTDPLKKRHTVKTDEEPHDSFHVELVDISALAPGVASAILAFSFVANRNQLHSPSLRLRVNQDTTDGRRVAPRQFRDSLTLRKVL
jgi:hypothetical protein